MEELKNSQKVAVDSEHVSRLHAQLSAMSQIIEIKKKQADEAVEMHNTIVREKAKCNNQTVGPFDEHYFTLHGYLLVEIRHYANEIEKILEELGGTKSEFSDARAELIRKLNEKFD